MDLQIFMPSEVLKPFIKHYRLIKTEEKLKGDLYPSGYVELAINISGGDITTVINDRHIKMPDVEVFGRLTSPAKLIASGGSAILIARFYPQACSLFFPNQVSAFTNDSIDLNDIFNKEEGCLYDEVMMRTTIREKINVLELFLLQKLKANQGKLDRMKLIERLFRQIDHEDDQLNVESLAQRLGCSERYIQKLFSEHIGVSPKVFLNIHRFNRSLDLIQSSGESLTSIAYTCGYYDQAHFIKEFRLYTGMTPSRYKEQLQTSS